MGSALVRTELCETAASAATAASTELEASGLSPQPTTNLAQVIGAVGQQMDFEAGNLFPTAHNSCAARGCCCARAVVLVVCLSEMLRWFRLAKAVWMADELSELSIGLCQTVCLLKCSPLALSHFSFPTFRYI